MKTAELLQKLAENIEARSEDFETWPDTSESDRAVNVAAVSVLNSIARAIRQTVEDFEKQERKRRRPPAKAPR